MYIIGIADCLYYNLLSSVEGIDDQVHSVSMVTATAGP